MLKRYQVGNSIEYRKLADDLCPGGGHGYRPPSTNVPEPAHRAAASSKADGEQLESIKRRVLEALNREVRGARGLSPGPGVAGLHEEFARADVGGSSGGILGDAFCAALTRMANIRLT